MCVTEVSKSATIAWQAQAATHRYHDRARLPTSRSRSSAAGLCAIGTFAMALQMRAPQWSPVPMAAISSGVSQLICTSQYRCSHLTRKWVLRWARGGCPVGTFAGGISCSSHAVPHQVPAGPVPPSAARSSRACRGPAGRSRARSVRGVSSSTNESNRPSFSPAEPSLRKCSLK